MSTDNTIFDDVFRTLLEKMPHLAIPLINEVFHTAYDENEMITQLRNEHQTKDGERITDSSLLIGNKIYHIECQSTSDSTMVIRMIEYDFFIALEYAEKKEDEYRLEFPRSCVLYLRHNSKTKDELRVNLSLPNGETIVYNVPIIKVQEYTRDVIFQKKLLFLLPFYVMRYEKEINQIENDTEKLNSLLEEYEDIRNRMLESLGGGEHGREYAELVELIIRISDYIFREKEKTRKGVSEKMGGKVLELEVDKAIDKAYAQGITQGITQGISRGISTGIIQGRVQALYTDAGFTPAQIVEKVNLSIEEVMEILQELNLIPEKEDASV